jgi:hypothetical protein
MYISYSSFGLQHFVAQEMTRTMGEPDDDEDDDWFKMES